MEGLQQPGFWPFTATVDWCEENYTTSFYIAEFWNTISNLVIMFFGLFGIYTSIRCKTEIHFILAYFFLFIVGIGSFIFHCTLTWEGQLLDEVPMIFTSMPLLYAMAGMKIYDQKKKDLLKILLYAYPLFLIPVYVYWKNYEIFLVGYAVTVWIMIFWGYYQGKYIQKISDQNIHIFPNQPISMYWKSIMTYGMAFVFWVVDQAFCDQLKQLKSEVGPFFSPFLEFHAIWHFGSGYGTYLLIVCNQQAYALMNQFDSKFQNFFKEKSFRYKGDHFFKGILPYIRPIREKDLEHNKQVKVE
ncbi:hypothetical protein PPERSA_04259 [Pseudocohnilembus persalinus]|uniref:Ceramidase n=1 Tax=Pseudocohnilembus persalinus TaxID=266149 RepID=A0A0V0QNJ9_PSEPJ|nr:hypothetical protein PPERSA_04259 [Pseudocohnilembus persalinus]|eukprot:KRX03751.1 hypothetical protein PPERSA_04259 [Pseudocohnilembus persalinus]